MKKWVVPECLHVPVVAEDEKAITDHIGDIVDVLSPGRAFLVAIDSPPERDSRLPIWDHPLVDVLFDPLQVWVKTSYTRYRPAYIKAKGYEAVAGKVLGHAYNRQSAFLRGYEFVRIVPISRTTNSSSAYTEQWGVERALLDLGERKIKTGLRIQYADLSDLLQMLDISLGGGVQEVYRIGRNLIEVPGVRKPQR